jgi:hypothetical protein
MFKALAITALMFALAPKSEAGEGAMPEVSSEAESEAIARAKETLAQSLSIDQNELEVVKVEARTWRNSTLGCAKPGTIAREVITPGHAVTLNAQGREHSVHVSHNSAIVCDRPMLLRKQSRGAPIRGLDQMIQRAKEDLAQRLNVDVAKIRAAGFTATTWRDSAMECPGDEETIEPGPLSGYRLSLRYLQGVYTYHTDMRRVRACPPIAKD